MDEQRLNPGAAFFAFLKNPTVDVDWRSQLQTVIQTHLKRAVTKDDVEVTTDLLSNGEEFSTTIVFPVVGSNTEDKAVVVESIICC